MKKSLLSIAFIGAILAILPGCGGGGSSGGNTSATNTGTNTGTATQVTAEDVLQWPTYDTMWENASSTDSHFFVVKQALQVHTNSVTEANTYIYATPGMIKPPLIYSDVYRLSANGLYRYTGNTTYKKTMDGSGKVTLAQYDVAGNTPIEITTGFAALNISGKPIKTYLLANFDVDQPLTAGADAKLKSLITSSATFPAGSICSHGISVKPNQSYMEFTPDATSDLGYASVAEWATDQQSSIDTAMFEVKTATWGGYKVAYLQSIDPALGDWDDAAIEYNGRVYTAELNRVEGFNAAATITKRNAIINDPKTTAFMKAQLQKYLSVYEQSCFGFNSTAAAAIESLLK